MKRHRMPKVWLLAVLASLIVAALAAAPLASRLSAEPPKPADAVQQAWQRARDAGAYRFSTDLSATAYPAPTLANVGQPAREERLHLEGSVDLPARTLLLNLWQGAGSLLNPSDGVEVRIEGDRAYGRQAGGHWEEIDGFSGSFAPGGDLLAYLVGARNVVDLGSETVILPGSGQPAAQQDGGSALPPASFVTYTRYSFELDGPALAEEVRRQWQRELLEQGGVPAGVEVQAPAALRDATGRGELWLDSDGLPARLTVEIAYPPDAAEGGSGGRATIQTDFSGFAAQEARGPGGWLAGILGLKTPPFGGLDPRRVSAQAALLLAVAGLSWLLVRYSRWRRLYIAVVLAIILSMVITPLAEAQRTVSFGRQQAAQRAAYEKRQAEAQDQQEYLEATHTSSWDPLQDPLAASEETAALANPSALAAGSGLSGAGLVGPYQVTQEVLADEAPPEPESDADLDTLTAIEEERLGTDPDNPDTDGDQLRDDLEVKGFDFTNPATGVTKHYYIDPLNVDTNSDGRPDLQECWTEFPLDMPSSMPCNLDTDADGVPDLFDRDDDGDGVEDGLDLSPASRLPDSGGSFSGTNPLLLKLDDLQPGFPTFVSLQLRPTNPAHLTYAFGVLDWPMGDAEGQVQRVLDTTLADGMTQEEIQKDPRSANGDLRLIPMVEITVPYRQGHTRNLPVKPGWSGTLGATTPPLEEWVDTKLLAHYGLTVRYADQAGTVVTYAPLSLVSDEIGSASVAFTTRLPYQPMSSGDWGNEHQVRVVWALQMLVDQCKEVPDGQDAESWCAKAENREEQVQIVHTYDESWVLTGLDVREDHGLEMAIAFEDRPHDSDLLDDRNLWALANGLDEAWISARDCDTVDASGNCVGNGQRDLTVPEIVHRFDSSSNGDIPAGDARLWNIPKDALKIWTKRFAYQDLMAAIPMTHTKEILNQHFLVSGEPVTPAPTLMFLREEHYRSANLDARAEVASWTGGSLTLHLAAAFVSLDTMAAMNWAPYRHRDGAWEPYPIEEYVQLLDPRLAESFPVDPNDPDGQAVSDGQVIMARGYYLGMVQGIQDVVQSDQLVHPGEGRSRDEKLKEQSIKVAGDIVLMVVKLGGERIAEAATMLVWIFAYKPSSAREVWEFLGSINRQAQGKGGWTGWSKESTKWLSRFSRLSIATLLVYTLCATVLFVLSIAIDSPVITYVQRGLTTVAGVIRWTSSLVKFINDFRAIYHEAAGLLNAFKTLFGKASAPWSASAQGAFVLTIVIEVAVALGMFIYAWASSHIRIGSLAWDQMLVDMIARIVVKTLLWALNFIPVIGKVIFLLISALDALAAWICSFLSEEKQQSKAGQWLCGGISGILSRIFGYIFYGQHKLIDMEDDERWQPGVPRIELGDPSKGLAVGNTLVYQLTLTNSIRLADLPNDWKARYHQWQYKSDNLKRASFGYAISGEATANLHSGLRLDQISSEWAPGEVRDGKQSYYIVRDVDTVAPGVPLVTAGINITTPVYLHEGYAAPVQECIAVPGPWMWILPICWVHEDKDTWSVNLGESFLWDVFPESLDKFHELAELDGGYSLAWAQSGDLRFARQKNSDGDPLVNGRDGGPDPNDSTWDADHDGLSDYFELEIGLKPDQAGGYDPDGDGLNDRDELLLGTDPFRADTDGDGLTDRLERDGWEFAYGLDPSGRPKITWVTSNPLLTDGDRDTLTDFQEYNYRYHPLVPSDPNVLGFASELSERTSSGYIPSDGLVRSGDQLRYEATVKNKTMLSTARGLHAARFPTDRLSGSVASRSFQLYPQESKTLSGDLSVKTGIPSGPADVVQTAGARITYALADSDYAQLVLHLEDPAAATTFADSSGNVPPRNGQCSGAQCPTLQTGGAIGSAARFDATKQQVITVPEVDISAGDLGVSLWFRTSQNGAGLFSSFDGSVSLFLEPEASGGQACMKVDVAEWTTVPCTANAYADDRWHHLALSYRRAEGANLFIDGRWVLGGYHEGTRVNPTPQSGVWLGYSSYGAHYCTGLLDEVVVYDRALTWQDINALYARALFAAHLDEPAGATSFAEDGGRTGTCSGTVCPAAGQAGLLGKSALFSGAQNIRFDPGRRLIGQPFTLAAWVLPTGTGTAPQGIVGQLYNTLSGSQPTLVRVGSGIQAVFGTGPTGQFVQMPVVPNVLLNNLWNHVVLAYGPNPDGKGQFDLYVNGIRQGETVLGDFPAGWESQSLNVGNVWAGASVNNSYPASPFVGQIDEVLIYQYMLTEAQVAELYRNQAATLHLPFDEPPGTYQFQDALRRATASCPADLVTCPTGGVAGRAGQAAEFDGLDDALDAGVAPAVSGTGPLSVAAWVRTSAAKDQVIVQQRSAAVYNGEYMFTLTAGGQVTWFTYGNSGAAGFSLSSARAVNDGKWHHVAAVREADGSARIYVDGLQDAYLAPSTIAPLVATNVYVGADIRDRAQYFDGSIDELHVVRRALSAQDVRALVGLAPRFLLHLEEAAGAYAFADDTELGHEAICGSESCPDAGVKGQINLAAAFDGVDDGLHSAYEVPASVDKTIMAWVNPDSTSLGRHVVVSAYWQLLRLGATWHVVTGEPVAGGRYWDTGVEVRVGQWQHLAVVFAGNAVRFFVNGHPAADLSIGDHYNDGRVSVGYQSTASELYSWDGRIDEVAIYERALTDAEVEALWLYQGQWVQEMHPTPLTVDNDKPASGLVSDSPYRPNAPVNLLIRTSDATSAVARAEWQVDGGAWQDAPPCDAGLGAAWCPAFDPALFHGPGVYTIHTRATDAVGNVSDTSSDPLYVDGAAPKTATTSPQDEALVKLAPVPGVPGAWSLPITGVVVEPEVASGVAGSGVRAVKVTLLDGYRRPAGDGTQLATVSGTAWTAAVTLSDPIDGGAYIIQVEAEDQVGNTNSTDTAAIYLDRTAPEVSLAGLPPGGSIVALHLDEAAGATQFADSSGFGHSAACGTACPTAGLAGKHEQAVALDGTSQSLAVSDALDLGAGDFTLAAWFQTSSPTWQTIAAASTTGSPAQDAVLLQVANDGKVRFTFAPDATAANLTSPRAFHDGQWHQAAAVRQGSELLLYVDGKIVATKTDSRALSSPLRLALGQHSGAEFFQGRLDEVHLLPVALSGSDLYNLASQHPARPAPITGIVSEVPPIEGAVLELHLEETSGERFADSSPWANDAVCSGTTCPARVTSGTFFGQALRFDGIDDRATVLNWGALTTLTAAAWVQRTGETGTRETILSHKEHAGCGFVLSLNESGGSQYPRFFVKVGSAWPYAEQAVAIPTGEWVHLAGTYDGQTIRLFRDGVQVAEKDAPGTMTDECAADTVIGSQSSQDQHFFPGLIDEVTLFNRVLSRDELLALAAKKHAGVAALDLALTPTTPGSPLYNAPMPPEALVYLPFDDALDASGELRFLDISGQGHSGGCSGTACPSVGHTGHAGGAARFDGMDDYVEIPLDLSEVAYGLALWFRTGCAKCGIFSVDSGTRGAGGHDRHVYLSGGNVCARIWSDEVICTSGTNYADDRWHQVIHTFGGSEGKQKLYVDGALMAFGTKAASDFTTQDGINIGFSNDAGLDYFSGLIDELVIFSRALPAAEVMGLYLGTDTVLRLPFDESWVANDTALADTSGFANDATLHGATANHAVAGTVGSSALKLNGASEYVTTASSIDFARGDYTVSGWFRTNAAVRQVLLSATNPSGDTPGIQLYLDSEGKAHWLHRAPTGASGGTDLLAPGVTFNDGAWHHVAGVRAGKVLTLYVDGWPYATGTDTSSFGHALNVTLGRQGKTTADAHWNGVLDDVRVYARALSAEELEELVHNQSWQSLSPQTGVVRSSYIASLSSMKLEGHYRVDLRSTDVFGNRGDTTRSVAPWSGPLDSKAPRAQLQYQVTTVGSSSQIHYQFTAHDYSLTEQGLVSPCPAGTLLTREYFDAPWYRSWTQETGSSTGQLYALSGQCDLPYTGSLADLTVCDLAGNCTTESATPLTAAALAAVAPQAGGVLILEPAPSTFLTTTLPVQIRGGASSPDFVRKLTIRADGNVIDTTDWARSTMTDTTWTTPWTPDGEGPHQITATLEDWAGGLYTDSVTVILDTVPPQVAITTAVLTSTHLAGGQVSVEGTADDASGIAAVDVQVRDVWRPAIVREGAWTATWTPELAAVPDGQTVSGVARAVDRAGWTTLASRDVYVDAVAPAAVDLALRYQAGGETIPVTQAGTTVREPGGALQMTWTASSDGSGLAGYRAGWTAVDASGSTTTAWTAVGPAETRLATTTPGEAQKLVASLGTRDLHGNTAWQDFGPIYVDGPLTPDYAPLDDPDGTYHGWMDSGCTLLGTDRRLSRVASSLAMRHGEQSLYATWDSRALRLAWSGANWSADGDLFIYLDTVPGGTDTVFDPYTPTHTLSVTPSPASLKLVSPAVGTAVDTEPMLADYGVWVEDGQTAWLLAWDGSAWNPSTLLSETQYQYQPSSDGGLTDLYLPFDLLGVADPAATPLGLLAFASEEEALRLWAILPRANPVTSLLASGALGRILRGLAVPMTHSYRWPSLGPGTCPNGNLGLAPNQTPYPDAEVQARLTVDPAGTVYHYLGDHLYAWADYLLGDKPLDFSGLLEFLDCEHPYVGDGQTITYTLHLQNSGQEVARDVAARVWSAAALILPGGAPSSEDEHRYFQEVAIGDLAPGEERTVTFQGRVDLAWAQPQYEECLAAQPDRPRLCELFLRNAALKVEIVDQTHTLATGPLERIWGDHRVDFQAPRFVGISLPDLHISASGVRMSGYAYDDSGVPYLSLEVQRPDGATVSLPCPNPTPAGGTWTCSWDPTAVNGGVPPQDGQTFQVRLRATDGIGLTSDPGPWLPFVVDTVPPTVTVQLPAAAAAGLPVSLRTLPLRGSLADHNGAAGVEVCLEQTCRRTPATLGGGQRLVSYADRPAAPVPLAACDSGQIERTFLVTDTFVLRAISVGLRAEHPDRDQIRADLISPAGTRVRVLSGEGVLGSEEKDYAVLLLDAAGGALTQLSRNHDLALPGFLQLARPDEPLSAFIGEQAAGTWRLVLCDTDAGSAEGNYLEGRLVLRPQNTAVPNGTWSQHLVLPELDGVAQTLTVYGLDDAGNRSSEPWSHTSVVDNVPPTLSVTQVVSQVQLTPDLAPIGVLTGMVADGGQVRRLFALVRTPKGQLHIQPVAHDGDGWSFSLRPLTSGVHAIHVAAEDLAGNRTTIGPFAVAVAGIAKQLSCRLYLPLVLKGVGRPERAPELAATVIFTPTATITPTLTLTSTPTATITPTVIPTPKGTMTSTPTLTPTMTTTLTPAATMTPTLTLTPIRPASLGTVTAAAVTSPTVRP